MDEADKVISISINDGQIIALTSLGKLYLGSLSRSMNTGGVVIWWSKLNSPE